MVDSHPRRRHHARRVRAVKTVKRRPSRIGDIHDKTHQGLGPVAPRDCQSRRRACRRPRGAGIVARALGLCRLSRPPGQVRGRQHAGRSVRHRRPLRHRGARAIDRQDLHRRQSRRRRRQYRHGIRGARRTGRLHHFARHQCLFGELRALQSAALRSLQGFCRGERACDVAEHVRGQVGAAGKEYEGFHRARPRQSRAIQLRDAADWHHGAAAIGTAQDPRKSAKAFGCRVQGRRGRRHGAAQRHRATELGLAGTGIAAYQLWHAALSRRQRRRPLARVAGRADHGGGRLQGLRLRGRLRLAGAGEDAARQRQMAGDGNAQSFEHAGHERQVVQGWLSGAAAGRRRRLGARHQGNRGVQADHRPGRRQEALAVVNLLKRKRTRSATVATAIVALAAITTGLQHRAAAADYPARPITLIVPYPAGGGNDVIARLVAAKMSQNLGRPIVIENRGGAGSTIGTRDAARSAPDGYTLLIATSSLAINPSLYPDAAYDPKKDFAPIGLIATSPNFVLVNPTVPVHSVAELIALARKDPGKLDFASTGTGTSTHLAALLFAMMADVKFTAVPYKGVAPAITDLLGGQVALMFCPLASVVGQVRGGNLWAIAVTGAKRSPLFPDVPTVAEAGLPAYAAELHYGLVAPAGTPPNVIAKLNGALNNALADDEVKSRLAADGTET